MEPLTLPATLDALGPIRAYIRDAAEAAGLDHKRVYGLSLAADEIATNIITHGYEEAGLSGDITVVAHMDDEQLAVTLSDRAVPYDPLAEASPDDLDEPLEDRGIGGLGIFLARQNVDSLLYEYRDGQNHTTFVMYLDQDQSDAHEQA